jgi:NAD(P)-dependent dehydrogenase (short-subunit alcohol dehydrogenase family)
MTRELLAGKVIAMTGSGRGLGRAYAVHAAGAGAAVVVNDIDPDAAQGVVDEITAQGGQAVACAGSVTDPDKAEELIETCTSRFGRFDGLVNNAGVLYEAPAWETSSQQARTMVEVNLLGSIFCGHAAIAALRARGGSGSIVNVTSGTHLGQPGLAVYGATKGAIASLTYGWALDVASTDIRVNAVSPLAITQMKLPPYEGHAAPEDIAAVVTYLLSDASAGITGQIVRRARQQLGLIRHPAIGTMLTGDWCLDGIADAFDSVLKKELEPVGFGAHLLDPRATS